MDNQQDPLIERVEKRLASGDVTARGLVYEILNALADDLPEHFGPDAQAGYRRYLRRRADLVDEDAPYVPAVLSHSWQWE